jgi:hypothetical protein
MDCAACDQLKRSVDRLKREYEHSRGLLDESLGVMDAEAYTRRKRLVDEARLEYQLALNELEQHMTTSHTSVH